MIVSMNCPNSLKTDTLSHCLNHSESEVCTNDSSYLTLTQLTHIGIYRSPFHLNISSVFIKCLCECVHSALHSHHQRSQSSIIQSHSFGRGAVIRSRATNDDIPQHKHAHASRDIVFHWNRLYEDQS